MARVTTPEPVQGSQSEQAEPAPAPGNALARTESRRDVLVPLDVGQTKQAMQLYQEGLHALLTDEDWQDAGRGEKFVKKSGWRKIAAWFSLDLDIVAEEVTYAASDDDHPRAKKGDPLRAKVVARATAPNGRHADGDGRCSINEDRFAQPNGRKKLDNDLPGTATTRACNRAISNLVGLGAVSGEEVGEDAPAGPPFGPEISADSLKQVEAAIAFLADIGEGPNAEVSASVVDKVTKDAGGYFPKIAGRAFLWLGAEVKALVDAQSGAVAASQEPGGMDETAAQEASGEPEPAEPEGEASVEEVDGEIVPEGGE